MSSIPSISRPHVSLSSLRIFSPLLSFLLVLALLLLWLFALVGSPPFIWSLLVISCPFGSFYDDPLLFPFTDDNSVTESMLFPSIDDDDFVSPCDLFLFLKTFLSTSN